MSQIRFIEVTSTYSLNKTRLTLSVKDILAMFPHENGRDTTLQHTSHNNGGYQVKETVVEIIELIKNAEAI